MKDSKTESFIKKAILVHGNKYDYSKVIYKSSVKKVCIICPEHGEFWQTPKCHLKGQGCRLCFNDRTRTRLTMNSELFIQKAKEIHRDLYDYSKVEYKGCFEKVCIICKKHGEFWQKPQHHLSGCGCKECNYEQNGLNKRKNEEDFINESNIVHNFKYDYSKVEYNSIHKKVCIICPIHGEFWQTPLNHLQGHGCSKCKSSKLESEVREILLSNEIILNEQVRFDWLFHKRGMILDFYLPEYNIAIECQGEQHFIPKERFGGPKGFESELYRDELKYIQCKEHNIDVIYYFPKEYFSYDVEFYKDKHCFCDLNEMINYIQR